MDAVFIDQNGNKKNFLYQYDIGQTFVVENFEYTKAPKVQFSIKSIKTAPSTSSQLKNGNLTVSIPDMLLTYGEDIIAYLYIEDEAKGNVIETIFISVIPRKRPADYIYTSEMFARAINGTIISEDFGFGDVVGWQDGNINNEKRYGYFVTANYGENGMTISKATSLDNVYGVAVEDVGFASNCNEDKLDKSGNLLSKYAYVCTSGFAIVIDNGTCTVGGMCIPTNNGTAIPPTNVVGYKVIGRVDANNIFVFIDPSMQTINSFQTGITDTGDRLTSHINNKSNPHSVSKSQVGLGNVPNVATNDQTPTYTEATSLSKLVSGEKLSVAFGKISKAITELISHIANKNNPHNVTKDQVGLGNVDNTSDANKPISAATQVALDTKPTLVNGKLSKAVLPDDISSNVIVETIAERDALTPFEGLYVHVKDATGDSTVETGWADYIYDGETWVKNASIASSSGGTSEVATVEWANITGKPSAYTPKEHIHEGLIAFISGTQTAATNAWTGVSSTISTLSDGLSIRYWVPHSSTGNVTLNLTLSDGTSTGALNCYTTGGTHLFSDIAAGTIILLTYRESIILADGTTVSGWWAITGSGESSEFIMTDSTTGGQWTLGVDNGKLKLIPVGTVIEPLENADTKDY